MKILNTKPPIYDSCCATFKVNPEITVFTYGDTLYNPAGINPLADHLLVHEGVHAKQQNHNDKDAALWWGKYLRDPIFRLDQEARAYGAQYAFICKTVKDRNLRLRILLDIARILSGSLYGNCVSKSDAVQLINKFAGVR